MLWVDAHPDLTDFSRGSRWSCGCALTRALECAQVDPSRVVMAGCRDFDLWGVPPPDAGPTHPWHGLGFFKAEFGGEEVAYTGAWERVLSSAGAKLIALDKRSRTYVRGLKRNIS